MWRVLTHIWFPLAVAGLVLLFVPAAILLVMNLTGQEAEVNEWLLDNFQITYAPPLWLALILLLVIPAIILLYFLKLKRKPLQVPSTFLWKKSIEDLHVNALFQWLRKNILLLLQLLVVLGLIFAIMGFRFHGNTTKGKHYILIVDNSASMAAADVAPSRLHWAKQEALKHIDAAGDDDHGMVIVFNSKATTLQGYTNNRTKLRDAVNSIEQTHRPTRIEEALILADSLANPARSTEDVAVRPEDEKEGEGRTFVLPQGVAAEVHLFSDGRFAPLSDAVLANLNSRLAGNTKALGNLNLHYHRAGSDAAEGADNVGIVLFNAVRWAGGLDKVDPTRQRLQLFIRVRNFRSQPVSVKLRLDVTVDGKIIHPEQRILNIAARKVGKTETDEGEVVDQPGEIAVNDIVLPPLDLRANTVLHAYLDGHKDSFALDDQAWLVVGQVRKAKVLIVGPSNPILTAFFDQDATRKVAVVEQMEPSHLAQEKYQKLARSGDLDLVIFDRCAPEDEKDLPQANAYFIDRVPPPWFKAKRGLKNFSLEASKKDHPLLRYLTTLHDVGVAEGFQFDLKADMPEATAKLFELPDTDRRKRYYPPLTRLVEGARQVPLLFTLPRGSYTDLVQTFPIVSDKGDLITNWPLQPSFPLFLRNLLYHLGNVGDAVRQTSVQPGEPMLLRPEAGVEELTVTPPKGAAKSLKRGNRPDFIVGETDHIGLYRVQYEIRNPQVEGKSDKVERGFAVNLLDAVESHIEPRREISIGTEKFVTDQERAQPLELWKWIILLALVFLLIEWYVYLRRIHV